MPLLLAVAGPVTAEAGPIWPPKPKLDHVLVQTSLYTDHFSSDPEHTNQQKLASVELHNPQRWLVGAAGFKNSFDQDSLYLYVGREFPFWEPAESVTFRTKLTAGALHGYRGEYRDKIPFNRYEIAPAALPSVGVQWGRVESDLIVFGTAGLLVTAGVRF
ncbi:hypothetical protein CR157_19290 [Halomonas sp. LBP4]|nr:hypothetical protein CR157_19290 [Halomonas sp. LBP4]